MQFCISFLSLFAQNAVTLPKFLEDAGLCGFSAFPETQKFPEKQEYSVLSQLLVMLKKKIHTLYCLIFVSLLSLLCSCIKNKQEIGVFSNGQPTFDDSDLFLDLPDIEMNGELIVLTLYGPTSYFEFRGADFGNQFLLAEEYAHSIGVRVRVDLSRTQDELVSKLLKGEGDIIAYHLNADNYLSDHQLTLCSPDIITHFIDTLAKTTNDTSLKHEGKMAWAVRNDSPLLAKSVDKWLEDNEYQLLSLSMPKVSSSGGKRSLPVPRRKVSSPMLNPAQGIISHYDGLFRRYAMQCGWDWKLLAAQGYQESAFDPNAVSWMGAQGLMQLMPGTARMLGVPQAQVFDPETNIRGAAKLIGILNKHYADIHEGERINFILAAYNAGSGHVDDARRLAEKHGKNPDVWTGHVDEYVLNMRLAEYYNDPVVNHGYFNGNETYNYVVNIRNRWDEYKKKIR